MSDHFDQRLRDGATQFASRVTPAPVHLVRARGDQRRHRKAAATVALAIAIIAGGGGAAYAFAKPEHPGSSPNPPVATPTPSQSPSATPKHTVTPTSNPGTGAPGTGATGSTSPPPGTTTLQLGHIVLQAPDTWRVTYSNGGDYAVSTGSCAVDVIEAGSGVSSPCPSFDVIAGVGPEHGPSPGSDTYQPGEPYIVGDDVTGCP